MTSSIYNRGVGDDLSQVTKALTEDTVQDKKTAELAVKVSAQKENLQDQQDDANPMAIALKKSDKQIKPHTATVKKSKEAKAGQTKLLRKEIIDDTADQFARNHSQYRAVDLKTLIKEKLKDGMTQQEILDLIQEYPNPSLVLEFLISVTEGAYKELMKSVQAILDKEVKETTDKREAEVAKEVEAAAAQATKDASEAALRIVQGGDLKKLLEHLTVNPLEATAIFKMLDEGYGQNLKKIETYLLKGCGTVVNKLKNIQDNENAAHMKNAMSLLKKLQAIIGVDRYFEIRNPAPKAESSTQPKADLKRKAAP